MDYNLGELEDLFLSIREIIDFVDVSDFNQRKYALYLSNGECINYGLNKEQVPHLLGVNITALTSAGLYNKKSSFQILKEMIDDPYRIYKLVKEGVISYETIFSEYIEDKIKVFKDNVFPWIGDVEFVCKYDSSRSYTTTTNNAKYDYILVSRIKDTEQYAALCLVKNKFNYAAMSSMYFSDKETMEKKLKEYVENQEITLLNGVFSQGKKGTKPFHLSPTRILSKLENMLEYKESLNCIVDTTSGYIFSLKETIKHMDKRFDDKELIIELVESIKKGNFVDRNKFLDSSFLDIVDSYNNSLCDNVKKDADEEYTSVVKERDELRIDKSNLLEELKQYKELVEEYKQKTMELEEKNGTLENKIATASASLEEVVKVLKPGE